MKYQEALIVYSELKNYSKRIYNMNVTMVGSLKRKEDNIHDIDLLTSNKIDHLYNSNIMTLMLIYGVQKILNLRK